MNYEIKNNWLLITDVKESTDLVNKLGGVPKINSLIFDYFNSLFLYIGIKTNINRRFVVSTNKFNKNKIKSGQNYTIKKENWQII